MQIESIKQIEHWRWVYFMISIDRRLHDYVGIIIVQQTLFWPFAERRDLEEARQRES